MLRSMDAMHRYLKECTPGRHWSPRPLASLTTSEDRHPLLSWLRPSDLPRAARIAFFLLPSSKMHHSFCNFGPTNQSYNKLK